PSRTIATIATIAFFSTVRTRIPRASCRSALSSRQRGVGARVQELGRPAPVLALVRALDLHGDLHAVLLDLLPDLGVRRADLEGLAVEAPGAVGVELEQRDGLRRLVHLHRVDQEGASHALLPGEELHLVEVDLELRLR